MVRILFVLAIFSLGIIACDIGDSSDSPTSENGTDGPAVTPVTRPAAVPAVSDPVTEDITLGRIERQANAPPEAIDTRSLLTAACQDDVMVLWTDVEIIHASLPCDRFWNDETVQAFSSQDVAIKLTVDSTRFQIFVETLAGGQAEFTVSGIWIE